MARWNWTLIWAAVGAIGTVAAAVIAAIALIPLSGPPRTQINQVTRGGDLLIIEGEAHNLTEGDSVVIRVIYANGETDLKPTLMEADGKFTTELQLNDIDEITQVRPLILDSRGRTSREGAAVSVPPQPRPTVPPANCTSLETSTSPSDVLTTLQVIEVCPAIMGDIVIVDGNHGPACMYDSTATGPVELTLQRPMLVNGLRIAFSGDAPQGSTMTVTLGDQQPQDVPIKAALAPYDSTSFALGQSATTDRVTVTPPVGICHLTIGT